MLCTTDTPASLQTFSERRLWQGGGWSLSAACVAWMRRGTKEYIRILFVLQTHHQKLHNFFMLTF